MDYPALGVIRSLPTHLAFASVLYLGGAILFGYRPAPVGWVLAAVASLLPDVDLPTMKVGWLCGFVAVLLERRFGHPNFTYSAVAWRWPAASIRFARITCWARWRWPTPAPRPGSLS